MLADAMVEKRPWPRLPPSTRTSTLNFACELVGINTAIFSTGGGNVGIGFAVPINMARLVMNQIVEMVACIAAASVSRSRI